MSKGPGRVERAITAALAAEPDGAFTIQDLGSRAYPGLNRMEKRHRVAIIRAMRSVAGRLPEIGILSARSPGNPLVMFRRTSLTAIRSAVRHDSGYHFAQDFEPGGPWALAVDVAISRIDGATDRERSLTGQMRKSYSLIYLTGRHILAAVLGEDAIDRILFEKVESP